jgi:hypothetical protein
MMPLVQQQHQIVFTCYWLGKLAIEEIEDNKRTITFSPIFRERLGHTNLPALSTAKRKPTLDRPIHDQCKHAQCDEFDFCY